MKQLYLDCSMGAAGDMLTAALLELTEDPAQAAAALNTMGISGVTYIPESSEKCGIIGTHMRVLVGETEEDEHLHSHTHDYEHTHSHSHSGMDNIRHWTGHLNVSDKVKASVLAVYESIAQAESTVHGVAVDQIHFHEVGSLDALADVAAVCRLMEMLGDPVVYASPVHVGSGRVSCAHGILPVPAPATAELLKGIPIYGGAVQGELCTPTGAALLKHFVRSFGDMPVMIPEKIGYGMGRKNFPMANCVRAVLGSGNAEQDSIVSLSCNLDDMTGEETGFAMEQLLAAGAADVFTQSIGMKKSRPGIMLTVLCRPELKDGMIRLLFRHTTTLGIRETTCRRSILTRREETIQTVYGPVRVKSSEGYGVKRCKPEYEDLARIAREQDLSIDAVRDAAQKA